MNRTPALLSGLGFLVGVAVTLTGSFLLALPLLPLMRYARHLVISALLGALYAYLTVSAPDLGREGVVGEAHLHLERISKSPRGWSYRGHLKRFEGEGVVAKNLPIWWRAPLRLEGDCRMKGRLTKKGHTYWFQPLKGAVCEPIGVQGSDSRTGTKPEGEMIRK